MVDKNDVYLNIKINYNGDKKEINIKDLLTIDELKQEIIKLFNLRDFNNKDIDLYFVNNSNNNEPISNNEELFFEGEEINPYLYSIEIKISNKKKERKEKLLKEKEEIKKLKEKKIKLLLEIEKTKIELEHNKKVKEMKQKINNYKYIEEIKRKLKKEILEEVKVIIANKCGEKIKNINLMNERLKEKIKDYINEKKGDLISELNNKIDDQEKKY